MPNNAPSAILYGQPPTGLVDVLAGSVQVSPFIPGAATLEDMAPDSLAHAIVMAPENTLARRYVLALALRTLKPGGRLVALAPKDKGGTRIRKELVSFGCTVDEESRQHMRICAATKTSLNENAEMALEDGAPILFEEAQLWTQPGVFSWDRIDIGTALLLTHMPEDLENHLKGAGADLGCGTGLLARTALLASANVTSLALVDLDRRAIDCAKRNVDDARASFLWQDVRQLDLPANSCDFVLMNPPFHDGGKEDRSLGQAFVTQAARILKPNGICWLVANRHLPYEQTIASSFRRADQIAQEHGYKIYRLTK